MTPRPDAALTKSATRNTTRKQQTTKEGKTIFLANVLKKRERNTNIDHSQNFYKNAYYPTKHQLRHDINGKMVFELQGMELLIDEHKLQIDAKNKLKNIKKSL